MKTLSILGSGWLGKPLIKHFVDLGWQVNASCRDLQRSDELLALGAIPCLVDIDTQRIAGNAFLNADLLIVNIPSKNIEGFAWLNEQLASSPIKHVILVSSTSVYPDEPRVMSEDDSDESRPTPLRQIEQLFIANLLVSTTVVRFAGLVGPRRHPGRFFTSGRAVPNPDAPVNMIHLDDCVAVIHQIVQQGCWGEIFNACADTHPSKREFYGKYTLEYSGELPTFGDSCPTQGKVICNKRLKQVLGYECIYPNLMALVFD